MNLPAACVWSVVIVSTVSALLGDCLYSVETVEGAKG